VKKRNTLKLINYANLAYKILEDSTDYIESKKSIHSFFKDKEENLTFEKVKLRLTFIDSIYSTNMSKRLFGINELALEILNISQNHDNVLIEKIRTFLSNPTNKNDISNIFFKQFGIDKKGKPKGHAASLISKYFYFLLDFQFPIYDSLVKDNLPIINKKIQCIKKLNLKNGQIQYFNDIIKFNKESEINDFNKLDNMCWLFGKINKGSFSLIINKNKYLNLIKYIDLENKKSDEIDDAIKKYIMQKIPENIFSDDEKQFIKWVIT
jgi:hypothetical protein